MRKKPYIFYIQNFNEKVGGTIAVHYLCHLLNSLGEQATIWPAKKPLRSKNYSDWVKRLFFLFKVYRTGPRFNCPLARHTDIQHSIVVYPETILGNPLNARYVVRWFLYYPEHDFSDTYNYPNELHFYYQKHFVVDDTQITTDAFLRVSWFDTSTFKQTNFGRRSGNCHTIRKLSEPPAASELAGSTCIDNLSPICIARVFNECEFFLCYDHHSFYIQLAIVCGCIPVVMPKFGVSKEMWRSHVYDRLGVAYGWNDLRWARKTRSKRLKIIHKTESRNIRHALNFIDQTQNHFN